MPAPPGDVKRVLSLLGSAPRHAGAASSPVLVLLAGVPGGGKSTLARHLAPRIPAVHLESDAVRLALVDRPSYNAAESARVFDVIHGVLAALLERGDSVILDATSARARHRAPVIEVARDAGARLLIVHVTAPEPVILERLAQRRRDRGPFDRSQADERVYRRIAAQFERIEEPHLRVETDEGLDGAVEDVLREIRAIEATG